MSTKDDIKKELQEQGRHDRGPSRTRARKPERHGAPRRGMTYANGVYGYFGLPTYGQNYYRGISGQVTAATGDATAAPRVANPMTPHLSADQFVGYAGGVTTDAGNYTGVQAIEGAAGNGGAGGAGDGGAGAGGSGAGAAGSGGGA